MHSLYISLFLSLHLSYRKGSLIYMHALIAASLSKFTKGVSQVSNAFRCLCSSRRSSTSYNYIYREAHRAVGKLQLRAKTSICLRSRFCLRLIFIRRLSCLLRVYPKMKNEILVIQVISAGVLSFINQLMPLVLIALTDMSAKNKFHMKGLS